MARLELKELALEVLLAHQLRGLGEHLHVAIKNDTVTLSGSAVNFTEKRDIETLVKEFAGHRKVSNHIRVVPVDLAFINHRK